VRHIARPPGTPAEGGSPLVATGRPLRWGVVATGSIARSMSAQLARLDDAVLHAVSSRDGERARAFAEEFGFQTWYGGGDEDAFRRLAGDPDVDVVYVAAPHGHHFDVTEAVLAAGKHALVEKSFTVTAREAERLVALARQRGVFLMEAVWTRFVPAFQRALDLIEGGDLGEVRWLQGDIGFFARTDPRRRLWAKEAGGGALLDLTVYPLTWAVGALGFPEAVTARGSLTEEGVDASNALTLSYAGGAQAQLLSTLEAHTTRSLTVAGTEGTLQTIGSLTWPDGLEIRRGDASRVERFDDDTPRFAYQLREVTRCVQEGLRESPTMPLDDSVATLRLFDEARAQLGVRYPHDDRFD
jgi:predicted dehydrogenase